MLALTAVAIGIATLVAMLGFMSAADAAKARRLGRSP